MFANMNIRRTLRKIMMFESRSHIAFWVKVLEFIPRVSCRCFTDSIDRTSVSKREPERYQKQQKWNQKGCQSEPRGISKYSLGKWANGPSKTFRAERSRKKWRNRGLQAYDFRVCFITKSIRKTLSNIHRQISGEKNMEKHCEGLPQWSRKDI